MYYVNVIMKLKPLKGRGYFTNEKDGRGGALWPPVYLGS